MYQIAYPIYLIPQEGIMWVSRKIIEYPVTYTYQHHVGTRLKLKYSIL